MKKQRRAEIVLIVWWNLFCLLLLLWCVKGALAQPTSSTISPRAFGSHSWRENGLAPLSLPATDNSLWDVRLASNGVIYYWDGVEWLSIVNPIAEPAHFHFAETVEIVDIPGEFTALNVEDALLELAQDPRWVDARAPISHTHLSGEVLSAIASRCARFDATGALIAAGGDCVNGDTDTVGGGGGSPGGANTQVQFNDSGVFAGDVDLTWDKTNNILAISDTGRYQIGTDSCLQRRDSSYWYFTLCGTSLKGFIAGRSFFSSGSTSSPGLEVDINPSDMVAVKVGNQKQIGFGDVAWKRNDDGGVFQISNGSSGSGTIQLGDAGVKPTCSSLTRGRIWVDFGGVGVADTLEICLKLVDDSYVWQVIPN